MRSGTLIILAVTGAPHQKKPYLHGKRLSAVSVEGLTNQPLAGADQGGQDGEEEDNR